MNLVSSVDIARVERIPAFLRDENAPSARVVLGRTTVTVWADGRVTDASVHAEDSAHGVRLAFVGEIEANRLLATQGA
jgi:hypothetical protein